MSWTNYSYYREHNKVPVMKNGSRKKHKYKECNRKNVEPAAPSDASQWVHSLETFICLLFLCLETNWAISFNCREHNEHGDSIKGNGKTPKAKDSQHSLPEEDTSQWVQEIRIAAILFSTLVFWSNLNNNFSNAGSIMNFIPRSVDEKRGNSKASNPVHFCVPIANRKGILKTTVFRSSCNKFLQSRESSRDSILLNPTGIFFPSLCASINVWKL